MIDELIKKHKEFYKRDVVNAYFAPGRVNLIGEHTDYNGGNVFPCSLDIGTYLIVTNRNDDLLNFYSYNFSNLGIIKTSINNLFYNEKDNWANYPKGVIKTLQDNGCNINKGFDMYFYGNIPNGAGLSSSASIELVTAVMLNDQFALNLDMLTLVKLSQYAENNFIKVNCGIMDQFAIGMGKKNYAILLDTNSLNYKYVPLNIEGYSLVVSNTNKRRGLADSKYNERRSECERALKILKKGVNINSLGELSSNEFNKLSYLLDDKTIIKRTRHAVFENQRTIKAEEALNQGDIKLFGKLMNESHISLRDDYEVTGIELDTLVNLAWNEQGVIGSRMTGAGFGGCSISIVDNNYIESYKQNIENEYEKIIGYKPSFYVISVGDGARKIL